MSNSRDPIENIIRQVVGGMALSDFILTDEDTKRIRLCTENPDKVDEIVNQLKEKHMRSWQEA